MKINSHDYRVEPKKTVKLDDWPATGNPFVNRRRSIRKLWRITLSTRFSHRDRDGVGMDIQSYKTYFRNERPTPFLCGSAPLVLPTRSVIRANLRFGGWSLHLD